MYVIIIDESKFKLKDKKKLERRKTATKNRKNKKKDMFN